MQKKSTSKQKQEDLLKPVRVAMLVFFIACALTNYAFDGLVEDKDYGGRLPEKSIFGPIESAAGDEVLLITLKFSKIDEKHYDKFAIEILDERKQSLNFYEFSVEDQKENLVSGGVKQRLILGPQDGAEKNIFYIRLRTMVKMSVTSTVTEAMALSQLQGVIKIEPLLFHGGIFFILMGVSLISTLFLFFWPRKKKQKPRR